METDLRDLIEHAAGEQDAAEVLGATLMEACIERRTRERGTATSERLGSLLPYVDFGDAIDVLMRLRTQLDPVLADALRSLVPQWKQLGTIRNRVAHSRPLEIDDLPTVVDFAATISLVPGSDWPNTREVQSELARDPVSVFGDTKARLRTTQRLVQNNLPPADFDETGFLGRRSQRVDVAKAILGPWPVVSILGDGGMGKTSLALQVAYDIMELPENPFDAIVWTTAKNATLTASEIVRIEGAIQDSLGLFGGAATELAGETESRDPIAEVLEYLETFRVLLVLDNLETVLDDNVSEFLRQLPFGSKVLITSRIGVGTENPFKLQPLSVGEGAHLLRTLARVRGVPSLMALPSDEVERLIDQMNCHPGQIKWFVSGVQAGRTPEQLIHNNGLLLDYCMENVFDYLDEDAKAMLRSMQVIPGSHTLAELAYLNDFAAPRLQKAILELTKTNFLTQVGGAGSVSGYALTDFAKRYLQKRHSVDAATRSQVQARHGELYTAGGDLREAHSRDPYAVDTIEIRTTGDFYAARCLRSALEASERGDYDKALELCGEAADLAPGYHEPHRIRGHIFERSSNYGEAYESYEQARDLAKESPYVHYFFGRFLCATKTNPREGLKELQAAASLDANSGLKLEVARAHQLVDDFTSAIDVACVVLKDSATDGLTIEDSIDIILTAAVQAAVGFSEKQNWSAMAEIVESILPSIETHTIELGAYDLDRLLLLEHRLSGVTNGNVVEYLVDRCEEFKQRINAVRFSADPNQAERRLGTIKSINIERGFAFVASSGTEYFLHASELWQREYFDEMPRGATVAFHIGREAPGKQAPATSVDWLL